MHACTYVCVDMYVCLCVRVIDAGVEMAALLPDLSMLHSPAASEHPTPYEVVFMRKRGEEREYSCDVTVQTYDLGLYSRNHSISL